MKTGRKVTWFTCILLLVHLRIISATDMSLGTAVGRLLRCCATNWKVTGSIPDGVIGISH